MSEEISAETFAHLVELAAFEFEADQAEYLRRQLNNQLKAIGELEAIDVDASVPPSLHGVDFPRSVRQALRGDEDKKFTEREQLVGQVPQFEDGYVIVPDIPHKDLD
jgi:aspartyl-tRNA(Asn)/glutamyl-tRNA(Gln) amidotransferase subunit C